MIRMVRDYFKTLNTQSNELRWADGKAVDGGFVQDKMR